MSPNFNEELEEALVKMYKQGAFDKNRQSNLRVDDDEKNS